MKFSTITVIGATGTMGANIAGIFASFGAAKVYLVGRDIHKVTSIIPKIINSVRADSIAPNLIPTDYSRINECVLDSDLVFDSTAEDISLKIETAKLVARYIRKEALFCSGTSGLSITKIAEAMPEHFRGNVFGVHMFNPPYAMPLCELIVTRYSDDEKTRSLREYLENTLCRTVVETIDTPAFLANRIGFQFINSALQFAEKYADDGGIDYIDAIFGAFTGRSMPPLATADYVGLDIHKAIVDNIYQNTNDFMRDSFVLPTFVEDLIRDGRLGKKTGGGLFKTEKLVDGISQKYVYDIHSRCYRPQRAYSFSFVKEMKNAIHEGDYAQAIQVLVSDTSKEAQICVQLLLVYMLYSYQTAYQLGGSLDKADAVMATGFNWCPPLSLCELFETNYDVKALFTERVPIEILNTIDVDKLMSMRISSKYDYRMYFKSI